MTEMVQPLRKLMDMKKYKGSKKLTWTDEAIEAFHYCCVAVSNCQELYFLEDTATPSLQTDASDYCIGGYLSMIVNHQVRVIRFFSKSLVGLQLNWSAREKEYYGIYYGVKLFEDLLDNRYFILKTCDTVARTGTPCTGTVRTCTSRTSGQPVIYSHVSLFSRIHRI